MAGGGSNKFLGLFDVAILIALWANVVSWFVNTYVPHLLPKLLPPRRDDEEEDTIGGGASDTSADNTNTNNARTRCILIGRPGGIEQLRIITLKPGIATCGYNVQNQNLPFTKSLQDEIPDDCVVLNNHAFSVNYADCCIRWGLYESANQFVGYPIVPGFDVAGVIEKQQVVGGSTKANKNKNNFFKVGDRVFGCSLFGSYSTRVLVPSAQLRKIPSCLTMQQAASIPAVALTALYSLFLAGHYPTPSKFNNKAILIHSAAGGVGSMLVQMSKILGLHPIVGVVGRTSKVEAATALGCDVVVDKQSCSGDSAKIWEVIEQASPNGYSAIMDSNGVSTLKQSYEHVPESEF